MDESDTTPAPSAEGIVNCLRQLAQEAATLKLMRTLAAIEDAQMIATRESGLATVEETSQAAPPPASRH